MRVAGERSTINTQSASKGITNRRLESVRVFLLGSFRVCVGAVTVEHDEWRLRKAASLVKLLSLAPGRRMHREQTMDLSWPASGKKVASNNLRQTLYVARKTLHHDAGINSRYLSLSGEQLLMYPAGDLWVDVEAFEEAAYTARRSQDPAVYRAARGEGGHHLRGADRTEARGLLGAVDRGWQDGGPEAADAKGSAGLEP